MRKKSSDYSAEKTYTGYGLTKDRVKVLLQECRAGKHTELVQQAAQQAESRIAGWIISSIVNGESLHDTEIMPCGRNSFYSYRKYTLVILDRMLRGKDAV